jgi:hypothetical protein
MTPDLYCDPVYRFKDIIQIPKLGHNRFLDANRLKRTLDVVAAVGTQPGVMLPKKYRWS